MYEIDREKFGAFVACRRREKGMTQKELAQQLYVSDKAVSKWERALSLPDIALLGPLAQALDVSVTELLSGRCVEEGSPLTVAEVEPLAIGALDGAGRAQRGRWAARLALGAALCALSAWVLWPTGFLRDDFCALAWTPPLLALVFGVWAVFFAKGALPAFYDENRLGFVSDGFFRMNVPGLAFNNRNWPHILRALRVWCCAVPGAWPALYALARLAAARLWPGSPERQLGLLLPAMLACALGGLFVPVYVLGKKYEQAPDAQKNRP